jgi:hypothetical protein
MYNNMYRNTGGKNLSAVKNITHKNTATSNKQCMKSVFCVCMCMGPVPRISDRRESKYSGTCVVKVVAKTGL